MDPETWSAWGQAAAADILPAYRKSAVGYLREMFGHRPLADFRIAIDCGGGMSGLVTPQVLDSLGGDTVTLNATIDSSFSARSSKPTKESLQSFLRFIKTSGVDIGIAHDGDGDRLVVVDEYGEICHEDTILAAVAREYVLRADQMDPVIITTPNVSARVEQVVEAEGGSVDYVPLGGIPDRISSPAEGSVVFAGEPWKHVHPRFGSWMDAVVSAGVISCLAKQAGSLEALFANIPSYQYRKEQISCPDERKAGAMERIRRTLPQHFSNAVIQDEFGMKLWFGDVSWVLVDLVGQSRTSVSMVREQF
ncbi:MAG: hypothetical protein U5K37_04580 [Natrialbaceae archaeon]|nr:hypothetical protein [Natrialbaceae archaeon]